MVDPRLADPEYLLAKLSAKLTLRGVPVTPEDNVRAAEALSHLPPGASLEDIRDVLAAVYAKTEDSYHVFEEVWNDIFGLAPPRKLALPSGSATGVFGEAASRVLSRLSRRIGQKSFAPMSVDAILEYGGFRARGDD